MIASDFQSEMIDLALFTRAEFDTAFKAYKKEKGQPVDDDLSTRDRLLGCVMGAKKKNVRQRNTTLLGAPKPPKNLALTSPIMELEEEDLDSPRSAASAPGTAPAQFQQWTSEAPSLPTSLLAIEQGEPQQDVTLNIGTATEAHQPEHEYVEPNIRMLYLPEQLPGSIEEAEAPAAAEAAVSPVVPTLQPAEVEPPPGPPVKPSPGPTEAEETYGRVVGAAELPVYVSALPDSVQVFGDEPDVQSTPMEGNAKNEATTLSASVHESEELCQTEPQSPPMPGAVVEPEEELKRKQEPLSPAMPGAVVEPEARQSLSIEATAEPVAGDELTRKASETLPVEASALPAPSDEVSRPLEPGAESQPSPGRAARRSETSKSGKAKKVKNVAAA
jgi:hypothetical protein